MKIARSEDPGPGAAEVAGEMMMMMMMMTMRMRMTHQQSSKMEGREEEEEEEGVTKDSNTWFQTDLRTRYGLLANLIIYTRFYLSVAYIASRTCLSGDEYEKKLQAYEIVRMCKLAVPKKNTESIF